MGIHLGFLGGASAIGASCVLVDVDGFRVVVDAGVRQARGETLPDLRVLQERLGLASPDAFVLTHAHLDHSGALPVLSRSWPDVPWIATRATADLVRILLLDSLKIMEFDREEEIPLFSADEVERTLARVRPVGFDDPVEVGGGRVRLLPAGHILGAGAAVVEKGARRVIVTGDLSVANQRTVPGMPPPRVRPEALVVEATYGDRLHASRDAEERRLAEQVATAVEAGGHVLVPAFAVGRAQEVLLILEAAMAARRIPRFPVWADGMVRAVCDAYRHHPRFLSPRLRKRILRGDDPFFRAKGFGRVTSPEQRRRVIDGPPCCVVASSGMLSGGASTVYAKAWAKERQALIAITGYQDEESPGRALLDLARGERRTLAIGGVSVAVEAQVAAYHLSAHADADEIVGLVRAMRPRSVYVVHGDGDARRALARRLAAEGVAECVVPEDGDLLEPEARASPSPVATGGLGMAGDRPLTPGALDEIRDLLLRTRGDRRRLTAEDVARLWFGAASRADDVATARALLSGPQDAFAPDPRRPYRFRPMPRAAARSGPVPEAELLALLERRVPPDLAGPYATSVKAGEAGVVLRYPFPAAARPRVAQALEAVAAASGWTVAVHPHANQEALVERARRAVPDGVAHRRVSIRFEQDVVEVEVACRIEDASSREEAFRAQTGWGLAFRVREELEGGVAAVGAGAGPRPEDVRREIARLFADAEEAFRPLKTTFPAGAVVLHFVHPGVAARHGDRIAAIERIARCPVRIHPHPNHQRLTDLVRGRLPRAWEILRPPAWVPQEDAVRVTVWTFPPEPERSDVIRGVETDLGCRVVLDRGD